MKKNVIVIVGPTAVGKTNLSIVIAKKINAEIISGDSMQVYQKMNIGTAKITDIEMDSIPHHMLDIKQPNENFTVVQYKDHVQAHINKIHSRDKTPILVGGSGLYIQAALYNYDFSQAKNNKTIVASLERELEEHGIEPLYQRLIKIDPKQAAVIHPNNHRRVIRALEIYEVTGKPMSESRTNKPLESLYNIIFIGLEMERKKLYERINNRVDLMLTEGLEAEVKKLYDLGYENCQSMQAIGYKEFIPYFKNEQSYVRTIELLKRNSRRYAKRQYTWFKNKLNVKWYDITNLKTPNTLKEIIKEVTEFLSNDSFINTK